LEKVLYDKINTLQVYKTLAAPGEIIIKPQDEVEKVDAAIAICRLPRSTGSIKP
jgi:hypothetical protein